MREQPGGELFSLEKALLSIMYWQRFKDKIPLWWTNKIIYVNLFYVVFIWMKKQMLQWLMGLKAEVILCLLCNG